MKLGKYQILLLWTCLGLFLLRVLAQLYVAIYSVAWLPPMKAWYSGLIPYPLLFPLQILVLMAMTVFSCDNTRKVGCFYVTQPKIKSRLKIISLAYFLVMVARYILQTVFHLQDGSLPIFFHWILAAYIYLLTQDSLSEGKNQCQLR